MNQDVDGNMKSFWLEVNGGKVESSSRVKERKERQALGEGSVRRIWMSISGIYIVCSPYI